MDLTKLWPTLIAVLATVFGQYDEQINAWVAAHPSLSMGIGSIAVLIANIVKSPKAS